MNILRVRPLKYSLDTWTVSSHRQHLIFHTAVNKIKLTFDHFINSVYKYISLQACGVGSFAFHLNGL